MREWNFVLQISEEKGLSRVSKGLVYLWPHLPMDFGITHWYHK